jgi:hypothetical protein
MAEPALHVSVRPPSGVWTDIYRNGNARTVLSSLMVTNTDAAEQAFQVAIAPRGERHDIRHVLFATFALTAENTFAATAGITLPPGSVVRGYSDSGTHNFILFGMES